ncbi:MAG: hypothetical protein AMXMBFR48_21440 [Ignavibacteriales bacterium]
MRINTFDFSAFSDGEFQELYDYYVNLSFSELLAKKVEIDNRITSNRFIIEGLDFSNKRNLALVHFLLDLSERLQLFSPFRYLYHIIEENDFTLSYRLQAASNFMININMADDYIERIEHIVSLLNLSVESSEDSELTALCTFGNFYAHIIYQFGQFNPGIVTTFKEKVNSLLSADSINFTSNDFILRLFEVDSQSSEQHFKKIHLLLDSLRLDYLKSLSHKDKTTLTFHDSNDYVKQLEKTDKSFEQIRQISCRSIVSLSLQRQNELFRDLQRGERILQTEAHLAAYMQRYGSMHYEKLKTALNYISLNHEAEKLEIFDWGCGVGLGSLSLLEKFSSALISRVKNYFLIEPSLPAITRAGTHIKHFHPGASIRYINKSINDLQPIDVFSENKARRIHIFSNILDIDEILLSNLTRFLQQNCKGVNCFICVSPYINSAKTERINSFVRGFQDNVGFNLMAEISHRRGAWVNNWSCVIRVFMVVL